MLSEAEVRALYAQGEEGMVETFLLLQGQVIVLSERVAELERRQNATSRTSHKPPSSDGYKKAPSPTRREQKRAGRKTGGQPGHRGTTLQMVAEPDDVKAIWPARCSGCGKRMKAAGGDVAVRGQVFDVPPQRLETTEYRVMECTCTGCGRRSRGELPEGIRPGAQYGSRIKAVMTYLHVQHLVPLDRTSQLLEDLLGASVSEGTIVNALRHGTNRVASMLEEIQAALIDSPVVHFDETGMRIEGELWWLHTAGTSGLTYYLADPKRGRAAHERMGILPTFGGTAVHDGYRSYRGYDCVHALCNAHHIRELTAVHEATGQAWAEDLRALLCQAHRWKQNGRLTPTRKKRIDRRYDALLRQGQLDNLFDMDKALAQIRNGGLKRSQAQILVRRLIRDKSETLRFVTSDAVPFDNNPSERDLRMMKVKQKVSNTFRTADGAAAFCAIRSYISTLRKQGADVLEGINALYELSPITLRAASTG